MLNLHAQVTQLNDNNSLRVTIPLSSTKTIVVSDIDNTLWVTDATSMAGTFQLSPDIEFEGEWALFSGQVIFTGSSDATGSEIYISDGTVAGTKIISDIVAGGDGSAPENLVMLNGAIYFTAETPAQGRELWKTGGTPGTTEIVKDIFPGTESGFDEDDFDLASTGTYLLFSAVSPNSGKELWRSDGSADGTLLLKEINPLGESSNPNSFFPLNSNTFLFLATGAGTGEELWKTDGTPAGTILLKDINTLTNISSEPRDFTRINNIVVFLATDMANGEELWKTDGTPDGTALVKDINPGAPGSTSIESFLGTVSIFGGFHVFNNHVYFIATNGEDQYQLWSSDGSEDNTILLNPVLPDAILPVGAQIGLPLAINLPGKFIFSVANLEHNELWESNGTPAGTKLFKSFTPPGFLFIMQGFNFDTATGNLTYPLFQGNKFFFSASTAASGRELWISDGVDSTPAHTRMVKEINPGANDAITTFSYLNTSTQLFFAADDGTNGVELWKSDGTEGGTSMVADINPGGGSDPAPILLLNNKVIFNATDGDGDDDILDLFVVDGNFGPLPVKLSEFTVRLRAMDAVLDWSTVNELNSKEFIIQRSYDGRNFESIGAVPANHTSSLRHDYSFTDEGIGNSGRSIIYYRIIAADVNGRSETTNVVLVKLKNNNGWSVKLLSNPVQNNLNLVLSGVTKDVTISIRDMGGKAFYTISRQNVNGQINIPVSKLPRGMYFIVATSNNERKTIQFIKQ